MFSKKLLFFALLALVGVAFQAHAGKEEEEEEVLIIKGATYYKIHTNEECQKHWPHKYTWCLPKSCDECLDRGDQENAYIITYHDSDWKLITSIDAKTLGVENIELVYTLEAYAQARLDPLAKPIITRATVSYNQKLGKIITLYNKHNEWEISSPYDGPTDLAKGIKAVINGMNQRPRGLDLSKLESIEDKCPPTWSCIIF